ncbi:hypothetical protein Angca_001527, partial [Angiostrongylus cantonensis]
RLMRATISLKSQHPVLIVTRTKIKELIVNDVFLSLYCTKGHKMACGRQKFSICKLGNLSRKITRQFLLESELSTLLIFNGERLPKRLVMASVAFANFMTDYFAP